MSMELADVKGRVITELLKFVSDYYSLHGEGVLAKYISVKYARLLKGLGDYRSTMSALVEDGSLQCVMKHTGGLVYYPADIDVELANNEKLMAVGD